MLSNRTWNSVIVPAMSRVLSSHLITGRSTEESLVILERPNSAQQVGRDFDDELLRG